MLCSLDNRRSPAINATALAAAAITTARRLLDALLPQRCALCAAPSPHGFCLACRPLLPWITTGCDTCGIEMSEVGICGACLATPPYYDHAVIPFKYRQPLGRHIHAFKYRSQLRHAASLGAMICQRAWRHPAALPEVLVPVPLHRKRLRRRGFNQALELARRIGAEVDIPVDHRLLTRIKNTPPQVGLTRTARRDNVRGAFQAVRPLPHTHIGLIDDVVTSGSTVNAAAHALKRAGATTVSVWAAARVG